MTARSEGERDYDHVLVGGGIASVSAAHALRREDPAARIAILCAEHVLPYQRQPLTKEFLAGNAGPAAIAIHPAGFYEMRRIDLLLGARVVSVARDAHVVRLEDDSVVRYGKLLIATGASPRALAVPGATLAGVCHLHDIDDALALRDNAARGRRLLVVGGGFTGIEAAATLRERGLEVTLVERCERLLPQLNAARLSDHFAGICVSRGVDVRTGTTVERFIGQQSIEAAVLADGRVVACDLVVIAVGVEPNCGFLAGSGIATADGVLVDECLQASDPDVHAAGDVARFRDPVFGVQRRIEHWDNAVRQGRLAARNMRGARLPYRDVSIFYGNVFDVPYNFLGNAADATDVVEQGRFPHAPYSLLYLKHRVLRAMFSIGLRADEMTAAEETIRHRVNLGAHVDAAARNVLRLRDLPTQTVLILQGGGALGAFESGAIAALEARGVRPDVVAAVSIGAFNGAIAASHPGHAAEALDAFWRELSIRNPVGVSFFAGAGHAVLAWHIALFGVPNFLRPHWWPDGIPPSGLAPWWTSCYDTQPMLALLRRHVDFDALAASETRLLLGAVDVESGERRIFDSYVDRITPEHLLASGSLPPAMPWTCIDGRAYWDGGIISNSPLDLVIERCGRIAGRVFVVDLFSGARPLPSNLIEVMLRRDEIVYADRVRNDLRFEENANDFRDLVERITSRLDAATAARMRQLPEYIRLMGSRAPVRVFRIALDGPAAARDTFARDFDFSETSISTLFERGRSAALEVLASDATEPPGDAPGRSGGARPPTP
ncbi:FAD-dependent oxidoreductase [Burkholderia anthina]|uniref:FAD-dependent oxidoreductase n=1 Tax=Burkholderia anthina TaxID=179879 RepID=UPI001AA03E17|nr:FAD-dependent oxidoreductase [Burkholderia anthina]QTD94697.1 FAD-dependent oxidoreductase [Burkholderia anthina]